MVLPRQLQPVPKKVKVNQGPSSSSSSSQQSTGVANASTADNQSLPSSSTDRIKKQIQNGEIDLKDSYGRALQAAYESEKDPMKKGELHDALAEHVESSGSSSTASGGNTKQSNISNSSAEKVKAGAPVQD